MVNDIEKDDADDDMMIFPLTEIDGVFENLSSPSDEYNGKSKKKFVTLRERRQSLLQGYSIPLLRMDSGIDVSNNSNEMTPRTAISMWKLAFKKISTLRDPWCEYHMHSLPTESVKRHRYNALKKTWLVDDILVKMQPDPFNRGAMRNCFRLKRVTIQNSEKNFGISRDVLHSSRNYVAKRYMEQVDRNVYFQDVLLQMDAKMWGYEFNKYHPPKQVDILQMAIIEFYNRPENPLYHLEHYIDGEYIKYNSNSGFVDDSQRFTPQAFSHFTFERSSHNLIVVDIQGVGDLWTDPQIHTADGLEYGDGNLGTRGMALFFHSHRCNIICHKLQLSSFDLASSELMHLIKPISIKTEVRGRRMDAVMGISPQQYHHMMNHSPDYKSSNGCCSPTNESYCFYDNRMRNKSGSSNFSNEDDCLSPRLDSLSDDSSFRSKHRYSRMFSESDTSETITEEEDRLRFHEVAKRSSRPSCIGIDIQFQLFQSPHLNREASAIFFNESILGQIHHDLANYHNCGRFLNRGGNRGDDEKHEVKQDSQIGNGREAYGSLSNGSNFLEIDSEAALFHETLAAKLGIKEALITLANLYLGVPTDVLSNVIRPEIDERLGESYMLQAAQARDRRAMIYVARAYVKGTPKLVKNLKEAEYWYKELLEEQRRDDGGEFDSTEPTYIFKAELAKIYIEGSNYLPQDFSAAGDYYNEAGEDATNAMKGKIASKYFQLAEEAYAQVPS